MINPRRRFGGGGNYEYDRDDAFSSSPPQVPEMPMSSFSNIGTMLSIAALVGITTAIFTVSVVLYNNGIAISNTPLVTLSNNTVTVENFPTSQTVNGVVDVGNFPPFNMSIYNSTFIINGTVEISNFPAVQTVNGTINVGNFPATQPVSGTVDIGNFPATQPVNGTVNVGNFPATQTVNGTVSVTGITFPSNINATVYGTTDSGTIKAVPVTSEGHLEVAIHSPNSAFGNLLTDDLSVEFQMSGVMGINSGTMLTTIGVAGGSVTSSNAALVISSGTAVGANAALQSRKRLYYRSGQGSRLLFSAMFTSPVANSYQFAGMGHAEDGVYFGYNGTTFGILWTQRGQRAIQTYTVTTANTGAAVNLTITLNSSPNTCLVSNAAGAGGIQRTVYEISQCIFTGWTAEPVGSTIVFLRNSAGPVAGTFTVTGGTVMGSFATTRAGVLSTDTFIPQSLWNSDPLNGLGPSGITLDPTKFNVYGISMQYLGAGAIRFFIETTTANTNDPKLETVHTIKYPNMNTQTSMANPSFPFTATALNAGASPITNVAISIGSVAGFVEGKKIYTGNSYSFRNTITTATAAACFTLFTIRNKRVNSNAYGNFANQGVINLIRISAAVKHTQPVILNLYRSNDNFRHTLTATGDAGPNFASYSTNSISLLDTSPETFTVTDSSQLQWSAALGETGNLESILSNTHEQHTLQPGESLTLCANTVQSAAAYVIGTLDIREDS